ncbi:8-oxo-dGDP phosphatase NUDT18 [Megalops cyprinoides]|uniref:8-oxo-dGDP phosphatase NUDT18 n=1 Tax=Megalops cyprinoides TaxID=118141 RepID=UPI0018645155|nr:8-oxo-dGDP phosphatase NUDT18 [Megalops cyprinoides]
MGSEALILEDNVEKILNGEGFEIKELDSVPEQVTAVALRKTVCYIVSAVIFNTKNEVLMMQEAKPECYRRWYLPAGRMEETESIVEGMRREVKEETGLDCQPITLLLVQEQGMQWIRFVFLAEVTGGTLKTEEEADAESIQAQWWDRESPLPLRCRDILCLIDAGLKYREKPWFSPVLPADIPCHIICQRLLLTFCNPDGDVWVLLGSAGDLHLPVTLSVRSHAVTWSSHRLVKECMPSSYNQLNVKTWGILGVQHNGRIPGKTDGICFNTLVSVGYTSEASEASQPPVLEGPGFQWQKVDSLPLRDRIRERMTSGSLLPLHNLYC